MISAGLALEMHAFAKAVATISSVALILAAGDPLAAICWLEDDARGPDSIDLRMLAANAIREAGQGW